ncbi:MAG: hypothetical protein NC252_05930 [Roseburia sp.]|nr:hypothetical protein [Roseburia sp.]MCM1420456.1 hypothetical protein [Bacteroides sp.]
MEKYIVLYPDTFLWFNEKHGVFYNCELHTFMHFECTSILLKYCNWIKDINNMYVVEIEKIDEYNSVFCNWIKLIVDNHIGEVKAVSNRRRPISIPPILNLQHEIEAECKDELRFQSTNTANNLQEITFFIGGEKIALKEEDYYKQVLYPINSRSCLGFNDILSFLDNNNINFLRQINLVRGHFSDYHNYDVLIEKISQYHIPITLYLLGNDDVFLEKILDFSSQKEILLELYFVDCESFIKATKLLANSTVNYRWLFLIKDKIALDNALQIVQTYRIRNYRLLPIIIKERSNIKFLKDYVYTSYEELSHIKLDKRGVFCNQTINSNYWGRLFIMPDGNIFTNINGCCQGDVTEDVMLIIQKEIENKESYWKYTRRNVTPCKDCIFSSLCPPLSNYEFYLKKFDLCTIKEQK